MHAVLPYLTSTNATIIFTSTNIATNKIPRMSARNFSYPLRIFIMALAALFYLAPIAVIAGPWIVIDANSGDVIAHNQATRPAHPASITKMMTAYTAFREIKRGKLTLLSPVAVSQLALSMPPSKMGFPVGTVMTLDNAIKMIMVKSANDIALAIAQSVKGSLGAFIEAMNENARRLGMNRTHFENPHGLHAPAQVTTARDMALLALALQNEFPHYSHYFDIAYIKVGKKRLRNHNRLLFGLKGADGFKTGYTCASGLNIVARANRNGKNLITVVLGEYSGAERNVLAARLLLAGANDNFNTHERTHVSALNPVMRNYAVPADLRTTVCKQSWRERQLTKKQRRTNRKLHLANLKKLRDTYLSEAPTLRPAVKVTLGGAFGPNPYNLKTAKGGTPPPFIAKPKWRPDKALPIE